MDASWRKVRGTVLTAVDEEEGYTNESLGDGLAQDHACRHLARIAHLYFARANIHFNLTNTDYSEYIPQLLDKIFGKFVSLDADKASPAATVRASQPGVPGAIFEDFGWLHRQSNAPDAPKGSNFAAIRKSLVATFDKKKFTRQQLGAFRLCQLMDCFETGNLFDFIFGEQPRQRMCVYYLPGAVLEEQVRHVLVQWFAEINKMNSPSTQGQVSPNSAIPGPAVPLSDLYAGLSFMQVATVGVQRPKSLALDLQEFFIFRLFSWFVFLTDPPPITNIQPLPQPSLSASFAGPRPQRSAVDSFKTLNLFKTRISTLLVGEPSLDLFYRYLHYFIPYASGGDARRADERAKWLFMNVMIEQWLTRNNIWATGNSLVETRTVGTLTLTSSAVGPAKKELLPPTMQLVKAMAITITYLQNEPSTSSCAASEAQGFLNQELRGSSEALQVLRRPLYHYFINSISNSSKTCSLKDAGFVHAVNLWLMFLSPWAAKARTTIVKAPSSTSAALRSKLAATTANVKAAVQGSPTKDQTSKDGTVQDNGSSTRTTAGLGLGLLTEAKSQVAKPVFNREWLWFVVQHYVIYADVLRITLLRLQDNSVTKAEFSAMVEAFRSDGVFCDPVVAVLRACEALIEDAMAGNMRDIYTTVLDSFPWMDNATQPAYSRSVAAVDASRQEHHGSIVRAVVLTLGENRPLVLEILKLQFAELNWDLSKTPLPSIANLRETVERVLQQMHWQQSQSKKSKQAKGTSALAAGEAALSWFNRAIHTTAIGGKTALSETELIAQAIGRLHQIFGIPTLSSSIGSKMSAVERKSLQEPETEVVFATPPWLQGGAKCSYRRLTQEGRAQIATGERNVTAQPIEYIGDALLNPPPICSYEIALLVRLFHGLSLWLNRVLKLNPVGEEEDLKENEDVYEEKFRINLRLLADMRNLIFGVTVLAFFDLTIFRLGIVRYCIPLVLMLAGSLVLEDLALLAFNGTIGTISLVLLIALTPAP